MCGKIYDSADVLDEIKIELLSPRIKDRIIVLKEGRNEGR